jgi:glycosyltransferase involved in cell wall biosynthesis
MPDNTSVLPVSGNSSKPLVSIIIPCYNCRKFLREAIESALAQSYSNVEVVVVDDGSTDETPAILQSYPAKFVQQTHQGVSAARNHGIRASSGEYLVFMDCDDLLLPDAVATGLATLEKNPNCGMVVGAHNLIKQSGEWIATRYKPDQLRDGYELLLRSNFIECTASVIFRRSCFNDKTSFRPRLGGAEDYDVYLRLARAVPMCCHNQIVAAYRVHSSNASRNSRMMLRDTITVHSEQWPLVWRSLRYVSAYFYGSMFWRRKYGRQLTVEMAVSESKLPSNEGRAAWRLLARAYPAGVLIVLISRMLPKNLVRYMLQRA